MACFAYGTHVGKNVPTPLACYLPQERRAGWSSVVLTAAVIDTYGLLTPLVVPAGRLVVQVLGEERGLHRREPTPSVRGHDDVAGHQLHPERPQQPLQPRPGELSLFGWLRRTDERSLNRHSVDSIRSYRRYFSCVPDYASLLLFRRARVRSRVGCFLQQKSSLLAVVCFAGRKIPEMLAAHSAAYVCVVFPSVDVEFLGTNKRGLLCRKVAPSPVPCSVTPAFLLTF